MNEQLLKAFRSNKVKSIQFDWSNDLDFEPKLPDCAVNGEFQGMDIYILCLKDSYLPDENSILFYNNPRNSQNTIDGDFGHVCFLHHPGYDEDIRLDLNALSRDYDQILFLIGRPKAYREDCETWIDYSLVENCKEDICNVRCSFYLSDLESPCVNFKFEYNKVGAMVLFELKLQNGFWEFRNNNKCYENGLQEIVAKYNKSTDG
jgi:stress response protein SCP2